MKKKTKTYILLVIVLAIWGIIGYRIIATLNPKNQATAPNAVDIGFNPEKKNGIDTFSIQMAKRDPFLGIIYKPKSKKNSPKKNMPKPVAWLPISYQGMIKKHGSKEQQIFAVTIENTQYLLKAGQTVKEISLIKGGVKEITVRYKNREKTIPVE